MPVDLSNLLRNESVTAISCAWLTTYLTTNFGHVYVFGLCDRGMCADLLNVGSIQSAQMMNLGLDVQQVYCGMQTVFFADKRGEIRAMGSN